MVVITIPATAFLAQFSAEAGRDAWRLVKRFLGELRKAHEEPERSHGRVYLRPNAVTREEWEKSRPHGRMPGWPGSSEDEDQLTIDTLMTDEEFKALFKRDAG